MIFFKIVNLGGFGVDSSGFAFSFYIFYYFILKFDIFENL